MAELPITVIETDHRLETAEHRASEALVKHRWHWTLDESNPQRASFRAYARAVGRHETTIRVQANGYAEWISRKGPSARSLAESMERAQMGAEKEIVVEAVAAARGTSFGHTRKDKADEIKRVRQIARDRAEQNNTTVAEEAPKVAEWIVKAERAGKIRADERTRKLGLRFVEMEGHLAAAKRRLTDALNLAHQVPWGDEERELLSNTVDNLKALLALIDRALGGVADVDWDAELEKLSEVQP